MLFNPDKKREIIMQHYLNPSFKKSNLLNIKIEKFGQSCSDHLLFNYEIKEEKITNLYYNGQGCAFFLASSDILCSYLNNKSIPEAISFLKTYQKLIREESKLTKEEEKMLDQLMVFDNVKAHYNRVNCCLMLADSLLEKLENE
ncbi:iron-sulfur cluster assembly scaffold protein [Mycoplasmopsis meleagridis]|uniref:iron-sulfur cluster assembly scaffold protein n=1 Tax=Mycoplasmopsis meleagridis TaxID=29561 RepID=UPI00073D3AE6|nr:iron-sulfur cluster assembly scaffold protein [Mycoplasmopsis meleagridis]KUH47377.1 hypothetical protein ASB56_01540 [Mycoplasmopsis meleagridis]